MPGSAALHALAQWAVNELENVEKRERVRRGADQAAHEELIGAIIANLARAFLLQPTHPSVAIIKSQNIRYQRRALRLLSPALGNLEDAGLLIHYAARKPGLSGTIEPTDLLNEEIMSAKLLFSDFARHPDEEVLELRWSHYERSGGPPLKKREELPIPNTPVARQLRTKVRKLLSSRAQRLPLREARSCSISTTTTAGCIGTSPSSRKKPPVGGI